MTGRELAGRVLRQLAFARHMPPSQMARRLQLELLHRWRVRFPPTLTGASRDAMLRADAPLPLMPSRGGARRLEGGGWSFRFLNDERAFPWPIPWDLPGAPARDQLWKMNLHYMEYLESLPNEEFVRLTEDWIRANPPYREGYWRDNWNAFALSIRCVVWMQQLARRGSRLPPSFRSEVEASLADQIRFLTLNLETDILGNHLIKNLKALLWAGVFFSGDEAKRWYELGVRHLAKQIDEQVLADGCHYERSPSYHCQVFADLLECYQVLRDHPVRAKLGEALTRMAQVSVDLCHPDGGPALFNDSGLTMAYPASICLEVYRRLLSDVVRPRRHIVLPQAGYFGLRHDDNFFLADCGQMAPDFLVAHGHADMLSFEWSVEGLRMIVDPGVFEYNPGPHRDYARAAASHNTITLDDAEPCAFFGAFRCGRRARASVRAQRASADGGMVLEGTHDGFARLPGRPFPVRRFTVSPDAHSIVIEDRIEGGRGQTATARFLLHPECALALEGERARIRRAGAEIELIAEAPLVRERAAWSPDMGVLVPAERLAVRFSEAHRTMLRLTAPSGGKATATPPMPPHW